MKLLLPLFLSVLGLEAGSLSLESYLATVDSSNAVAAMNAQTASQAASQRSIVQTDGFLLNGVLGYAAEKQSDRDAVEYHISLEKNLYFGNSDTYLNALELSTQKQQEFKLNQLKTVVYEQYINACAYREKAGLLKDAQERNIELTRLIDQGVQGGEFDRSSLLRSELIVDDLELRIRALATEYNAALQTLQLYTRTNEEPLCQDLPLEIQLTDNLEADSTLYRYLEGEIAAASALKGFRDTPVQDITVGVGYDNEIDLSRAIVFVQIPLTRGSRRQSEREAAAQSKLATQEQLIFAKAQIQAEINTYITTQLSRQKSLTRLNDVLVPKAYETSVLLLERFMGSEGSYLEYIDSQKSLFDLLLLSIDTRAEALLAQARIYRTLGIDPQKDIQ